jgi:hypothetical protein
VAVREYFKDVWDLAKKAQSVELEKKLLDIQAEFNALQAEHTSQAERIRELEREKDISAELTFRYPMYYRSRPGGREDGPFCARCWDVDRRLVRARIFESAGGPQPQCKQCNIEMSRGRTS